jgi:hypothetical protein
MGISQGSTMRWLADLVGLAILAAIFGCLTFLVPSRMVPPMLWWWPGFGILAIPCLFFWHNKSTPVRPRDWIKLLGVIVLLDMTSFCIDVILGELSHPHLSPWKSAMQFGGPFGFAATSILIPGVFVASLAGFVRSGFLCGFRRTPDIDARG